MNPSIGLSDGRSQEAYSEMVSKARQFTERQTGSPEPVEVRKSIKDLKGKLAVLEVERNPHL